MAQVAEQQDLQHADVTPREAVRAAADEKIKKPEDSRAVSATEWLLSSFQQAGEITHSLEVNVGSPSRPRWIPWKIRSVEESVISRIRTATLGRDVRRGRGGPTNEQANFEINLQVVVEGTVDPDIRKQAEQMGLSDPRYVVEQAFSKKPGLITQIAAEILSLSGFDDDDVRTLDAEEVKAAGN